MGYRVVRRGGWEGADYGRGDVEASVGIGWIFWGVVSGGGFGGRGLKYLCIEGLPFQSCM